MVTLGKWRKISTKAVLSLSVLLIAGCDGNDTSQNQISGQDSNPTADATPTQGLTCDAPNYFAEVSNEQGQINLTFGEQSAENILLKANPISDVLNEDGSRTYGYQEANTTTYARFYPDGTCLLQVVGADGTVTLEEVGQTVQPEANLPGTESSQVATAQQPDRFQEGFDSGYSIGYAQGENFRRFSQGNNPDTAFTSAAMSGNERYDQGYREGFYAGFEKGYDAFITTAPVESNQIAIAVPNSDNLTMLCPGNIQSDVDFTAYYTREAGFNRIDFSPRQGTQTLTSNLAYDGKDPEGHGIWRGNVAQMADVVLVHLSTVAPRRGDQVSVGYDNRWGRGNCG